MVNMLETVQLSYVKATGGREQIIMLWTDKSIKARRDLSSLRRVYCTSDGCQVSELPDRSSRDSCLLCWRECQIRRGLNLCTGSAYCSSSCYVYPYGLLCESPS
uniref:Uncharacterized protein n=1 Tax=Opuntia streptacantha TaxID=393608 RepID=A0A7C8YEH3_OPUST